MTRLRALAPAKVNLCLLLGPTRPEDGRHELVTVFQSLSLCDELTLETLEPLDGARRPPGSPGSGDEVVCPGVPGPQADNLAARALRKLRDRGWDAPPVRLTITKRIPVAAGMAGGSADAAATLRLACELAPGRPEEVEAIAAELGADVPAQLAPGTALGTGAGEIVERWAPLAPMAFVIVTSRQALATPAVFAEADRLGLPRPPTELRELETRVRAAFAPGADPPEDLLVNDLQSAAVSLCPSIEPAIAAVTRAGAERTLVSGSGPTVFGLFTGHDAGARAHSAATALGAVAAAPVGAEAGLPRPV